MALSTRVLSLPSNIQDNTRYAKNLAHIDIRPCSRLSNQAGDS